MRFKHLLACATVAIIAVSLTGCTEKGVNILEQPADYVGEFYVPSSKKVESGSALSIITAINEGGYEVKTAIKTKSDDESIIESYKLDCYGLNFEIFHYTDDSEKFKEISDTGKYSIKDSEGTVLREFEASINGHYVLFFSSNKDYDGNDRTEDNGKITDIFKGLELQ